MTPRLTHLALSGHDPVHDGAPAGLSDTDIQRLARAIAAELAPLLQPRPRPSLERLLADVWRRYRDNAWAVADLRRVGLVHEAETRAVGDDLKRLRLRGGRTGDLLVQRVSDSARDGNVYVLRFVGGDSALPPTRPGVTMPSS